MLPMQVAGLMKQVSTLSHTPKQEKLRELGFRTQQSRSNKGRKDHHSGHTSEHIMSKNSTTADNRNKL